MLHAFNNIFELNALKNKTLVKTWLSDKPIMITNMQSTEALVAYNYYNDIQLEKTADTELIVTYLDLNIVRTF